MTKNVKRFAYNTFFDIHTDTFTSASSFRFGYIGMNRKSKRVRETKQSATCYVYEITLRSLTLMVKWNFVEYIHDLPLFRTALSRYIIDKRSSRVDTSYIIPSCDMRRAQQCINIDNFSLTQHSSRTKRILPKVTAKALYCSEQRIQEYE